MNSKHKILVTGGCGMIGLEVCKQLINLKHEVNLFDLGEQVNRMKSFIPKKAKIFYGSILDPSSLQPAIKGCDIVIHLGALLGVQRSEKDKLSCIQININGTNNVLDCAIQNKVKKIVFASSSEVYGEAATNPIMEDMDTQGKTVYAVTKLAGEELCKAYHQKFGIDYTILRYFNCYGPNQTAQFVITKFVKNVREDNPPLINGDGKQMRSYTHVKDTARATITACLLEKANGKILNIGNGENPISLNNLAKKIISLSGKEGQIKPVHSTNFEETDRVKEREIFHRFCDSSKAQKLLDWSPTIDIDSGLLSIIEQDKIHEGWINYTDVDM